jgi:hypothetical protein
MSDNEHAKLLLARRMAALMMELADGVEVLNVVLPPMKPPPLTVTIEFGPEGAKITKELLPSWKD